ncbi:tryptophan synthase subunit alpha [Halobacteriales archaeon QH_7_66_36]|nr:MAG: tryptophan synthase subunit alpha [Halobacteriales archaeon QH_7_66_36]
MSDIEAAFEDGPAFVPYLAAGDPDADASRKHVEALAAGGADVIELGLPFSEPIAEGSTIQSAIVRSLEGGMTVDGYFEFVDSLDVDVPVVCMTYYNLIYQYGDSEPRGGSDSASSAEQSSASSSSSEGRSPSGRASGQGPRTDGQGPQEDGEAASERGPAPFVRKAKEVGIDGFVVPDLPAEEADPLRTACDEAGLDLIFIVAPTTDDERLDRLVSLSSGYVYVQARLGVTGAREGVSERTTASLDRLAGYDLPKAVGFGIKSGEQARDIVAGGADGIIVGSALVDIVAEGYESDEPVEETADRLEALCRELKQGAVAGAQDRPTPERT